LVRKIGVGINARGASAQGFVEGVASIVEARKDSGQRSLAVKMSFGSMFVNSEL